MPSCTILPTLGSLPYSIDANNEQRQSPGWAVAPAKQEQLHIPLLGPRPLERRFERRYLDLAESLPCAFDDLERFGRIL